MIDALKNLLEKYDEGDGSEIVLSIIFSGCINCENVDEGREMLNNLKHAVDIADIGKDTKSFWHNKINKGLLSLKNKEEIKHEEV